MNKRFGKITGVLAALLLVVAIALAYPSTAGATIVTIGGGSNHSLFIRHDGTLWAWGNNTYGVIGDGTTTDRSTPVRVLDNVRQFAANEDHTLAVKNDGTLWSWGYNGAGALGDGTTIERHSPVKIMTNVKKVSAGLGISQALKNDGTIWAWGYSMVSSDFSTTPVKLADGIKDFVGGDSQTLLAIRNDGTLWQYGPIMENSKYKNAVVQVPLTGVTKIGVGNNFCTALKDDGTVWTWNPDDYNHPQKVLVTNIVDLSSGNAHTLALKDDGTLWSWSFGNYDEYGNTQVPRQVLSNVSKFQTAMLSNFAIKTDNTIWAWGYNYYGNLGNGNAIDQYEPVQIFIEVTPVTGVKLNRHSLKLWAGGKSETLVASVTPSDASNKNLFWSSDNPAVATVDDGVVTPLAKGNAKITVKTEDGGSSATCNLVVLTNSVKHLASDVKSLGLKPGDSKQSTLIATYSDGSTQDVTLNATWTVKDSSIATVTGGNISVSTVNFGKTTVTAEYGGKKAVIQVRNTLNKLTANLPVINLSPGSAKNVILSASYADGSISDVSSIAKWTVAQPLVATVVDGKVTGAGFGVTTVTAEYGGRKVVIRVNNLVNILAVSEKSITVKSGESKQLNLLATYSDGATSNVTVVAKWVSSNATVATVENGKIVIGASKAGVATITAEYGGRKVTILVRKG